MIQKIKIKNLKSVQSLSMECSNVNLLAGANSSGKTSVIQSVLFVAQNRESPCGLNGQLISLGGFDENRCRFSKDKYISVSIDMSEEEKARKAANMLSREGEGLRFQAKYDYSLDRCLCSSCHECYFIRISFYRDADGKPTPTKRLPYLKPWDS